MSKVTVCNQHGCPELTAGSHCDTHAPADREARRSPSSRVTGTSQWRALRRRILARDNYICRHCGAPATQVDHLDYVATGGSNSTDRLVASCAPCNQSRKPARRAA